MSCDATRIKLCLKKVVGQQSQKLEQSEYQRDKLSTYTSLVSAIFNIAGRVGVPFIAWNFVFQSSGKFRSDSDSGIFCPMEFFIV